MSTTLAYAVCETCCITFSTGEDYKAEDWAEKHEDDTGHKVKIHYMGDRP